MTSSDYSVMTWSVLNIAYKVQIFSTKPRVGKSMISCHRFYSNHIYSMTYFVCYSGVFATVSKVVDDETECGGDHQIGY